MKFYSLNFDIINTNRRIIFISVAGNPNLHVFILFTLIS